MRKLLTELQQSKLVKVAGSYATGLQTDDSDIDFYVKRDRCNTDFDKRNILKIIEILKKHNIKWKSEIIGQIYTAGCDNDIDTNLEFADIFWKTENKLPKVIIKGIEFRTY